jgi:hypothetical protein
MRPGPVPRLASCRSFLAAAAVKRPSRATRVGVRRTALGGTRLGSLSIGDDTEMLPGDDGTPSYATAPEGSSPSWDGTLRLGPDLRKCRKRATCQLRLNPGKVS